MDNKYTKLSALVDSTFTIKEAKGYNFQKWDNEAHQMLKEDKWFEGSSKKYTLVTDKGELTLGAGQLGNLMEAVYKNGVADINNVTYLVKSNGKSGVDIRYFFNVASDATLSGYDKAKAQANELRNEPTNDSPIDMSDIPF